ncbi:hypothetical protein QK363_17160 [Pseudomonas aeruginosa]|uniref:hypothetical protein n=1 Tax=Pseudomonas aeruginosa group TaxID=136841 RepID=UPI000A4799C1|nr:MULTISPECIES: hypothetical protein [Pseudomonas aeruginosa group]MDI3608136.1 hypothetical protein [Pseudomonas aeruginosa]MDI3674899.1 hypothetical protein [Pseudomonas aeruginosa]MDI3705441.1 hypothetical protein [Pseudomonas aeruginosa]MDI3759521.1 hypothetical protein [Pseudomonas aeruginosa]MDI3778271.1 hypothetical protein [Pseudomonas aeruginosa]
MSSAPKITTVFLLQPHATPTERNNAFGTGIELLHQSIEQLVLAGRGDVGLEVLDLIHRAGESVE